MKKCHENSGGYACGYCDVILCVVAYFLSVNLLHFVLYVWHPHFPLKE